MRIPKRTLLLTMSGLAVLSMVLVGLITFHAGGAHAATVSGTTRTIALAGTGSWGSSNAPSSNDTGVTQAEFPTAPTDAAGSTSLPGTINTRSAAPGNSNGPSVNSVGQAKSNPQFNFGFEGLNHYQQRYSNRGNQFSVEPPDQGMCAGNGRVVEVVNDVFNVFDTSGNSVLSDNTATNVVAGLPRNVNHAVDLNTFFGYPPAIIRATGVFGQFVTDPSCLYDAATQRWFLVTLTLDRNPDGSFPETNHLDLAVSKTADPAGAWNIYHIDVTNDGTNPSANNACPCLGDYPHMGADANGIYLTTNSYPFPFTSNPGPGFDGAQIYALSKAQLAAGAASVKVVHFDTFGAVNEPSQETPTQPGFTIWPAQSPGTQFDSANGGTEFFMSSNAGDEANRPVSGTPGPRTSNQVVVWTLTNTSSLSGSPAVSLSNNVLSAETYAFPPKQKQPGSGTAPSTDTPQGHCLNDTTTRLFNGATGCWKLLVGPAAHAGGGPEVISRPDSNDTRMQQVMYANGNLWGALDTALNPDGGPTRAGIAYFIVNPNAGKIKLQGYLGAAGYDLTYPAIGVTESGRGVMAFTATSDTNTVYPSAAYAAIDANAGVSAWNIVPGGQGQADDDGFTGYAQQVFPNPIGTRWGDYGAAAVDGNTIWIASEYVAHACNYTTWGGPFFAGGSGDNLLGTCAGSPGAVGTRTALANWSTFISNFTP